jgi:EAL domain-containing protein (putative c-di-GMP-specific phosphodiesterase class I)
MEESYCGRVEGDEFVVVLPDSTLGDVQQLGEALLTRVTALEHEVGGPSVRVSASIGACLIDESCASMETLLNDAERAYRAAKDEGRGRVYLSQPDDARIRQMRESVEWVGKIEHALEHDALVLFGQRAQSLSGRASQAPDYVEVLLRMRSDEGGYASPEHFIVAAERYGQIHAIDRFVLQRLTRQLSSADRTANYRIAMNISGRNVVDRAFIDEIIQTWKDARLPQGWLCIELTETAAIQHLAEAAESMSRLRDAGVTLVLDDFGSGWSSYQYLRRLPFDIVKVDGAFIKDIATSQQDLLLARSINEIAHMLGKHTVAEHVENAETLELVREIGFDYAQGYVAARPVPLDGLLQQGIGMPGTSSAA